MMETTRKYPRTLNEAFRNTADYACAIEGPHQYDRLPTADRIVLKVCAVGFVVVVLFGLVGWI